MRSLLSPVAVVALAVEAFAQTSNVLLIIADDVGVDGIGSYREGAAPPPTPHIDSLASRGVLFRNAYSNALCSPTRCTIFTGRYSFRTGVGTIVEFGPEPRRSSDPRHTHPGRGRSPGRPPSEGARRTCPGP